MTTFEKCKSIRSSLLSRVGEILTYKWGDQFKVEHIEGIYKSIKNWEIDHGPFKIDPNDLTEEEMVELGFSNWDDKLKLIPIWMYTFLSDEFESQSISGEKIFSKSKMDNDNRFGCLAYGVIPTKKIIRDRKISEIEK